VKAATGFWVPTAALSALLFRTRPSSGAGACNLATHIKSEKKETAQKVNPLKASKRQAAGR